MERPVGVSTVQKDRHPVLNYVYIYIITLYNLDNIAVHHLPCRCHVICKVLPLDSRRRLIYQDLHTAHTRIYIYIFISIYTHICVAVP